MVVSKIMCTFASSNKNNRVITTKKQEIMKKGFKVNDFVVASKDLGKSNVNGYIKSIKTNYTKNTLYLVNGVWYFEKELKHKHVSWFAPTIGQMKTIKKFYPILKKENVKIVYEHGKDTDNGFVGSFGFRYEKGDQKGNLEFLNDDIVPMCSSVAKKYGIY